MHINFSQKINSVFLIGQCQKNTGEFALSSLHVEWLLRKTSGVSLWVFSLVFPLLANAGSSTCLQWKPVVEEAYKRENISSFSPLGIAQLEQESSCNPYAVSWVGAKGIAQFMPATEKWIVTICPKSLGPYPNALNPYWGIKANACYMRWNKEKAERKGLTPKWKFALSAYNGGWKYLLKEQKEAKSKKWEDVAPVRKRRLSAWKENRDYVKQVYRRGKKYEASISNSSHKSSSWLSKLYTKKQSR